MFWRSVVGKLWFTILLLVSFVLFILTILLLEFFENYHVSEAEKELSQTAQKISSIMEAHKDDPDNVVNIVWEILEPSLRVMVIEDDNKFWYSPGKENLAKLPIDYIENDSELRSVMGECKKVIKRGYPPNVILHDQNIYNEMIIVGVPLKITPDSCGAVFVYQSFDVVGQTTHQTTKIILLGAGIAIVLTTIFAFFLSTRITSPLRKMREAAFEVARGKFDTKAPILTHDEIGELAMAFNKMGRQLEFHITALNQEKEQLSGILSSMADGVLTINRKGEILVSNPPANRFLQSFLYEHGISLESAQILPTEMKELFQQAVLTEKEQSIEIDIQGRSWVILMTPLYDASYVRGAVAVLRDMTEERRLDKLRKDFIANVSHELRTPISMLQGYSEAIVDDIASTEEEKREIAQIIYDESLRMGRLVNELLDLARMEAGHIQLNKETVPLVQFLSRVFKKFQALARENDIHLTEQYPENNMTISIDPDRMEQVLTNLIDNAIRHTNQNGEVSLSAKINRAGVLIEVNDTGDGIPNEDLPFVFERFYKADKARTRGRAGTGLGLAIAKNIVEAHDGTISVNSKIGEGTTFSVFIPARKENSIVS